ncbi:MAG TPA: hypothetical protein VH988_29325 [Thermoanaerobaculia bacterium]|jgi:hypothetical protein|nr:hypothetical protein [Thermoanaerobaculia bacterium]
MDMRKIRLLLLLGLALASARLAGAQTFGNPLTADQVACEERQLGRLIHRMAAGPQESNIVIWRSTPGGGVYRGVSEAAHMVSEDDIQPQREEKQLAFDLILKAAEDLGDMRRPLLPQATLARRDAASNLVNGPDTFGVLDVSFDLAVDVPDPTNPKSPIRLTNLLAPGAGQSDRAGRSLSYDDLLSACHAEVTEFDLKIFTILARTVRATNCFVKPISACPDYLPRYKSVLFRGMDPLTYRMNVYRYDETCLPDGTCPYGEADVALLFHLQVDERGHLTSGDVQALPWCGGAIQVGCSNFGDPLTAVYVLPPLRPGIDRQGADVLNSAPRLNIAGEGDDQDNILSATINWADLLRNTAWN